MDALLRGAGYGLVRRDADGVPFKILRIPPKSVTILTDPATGEPWFKIAFASGAETASHADVIHVPSPCTLASAITEPLRAVLKSAEWEPVLKAALVPLMRDVDVIHTGGAGEEEADIEIHIPNPFAAEAPWVVTVQLKDHEGKIHESAAD